MLRDRQGYRKYLTPKERETFLVAADRFDDDVATFALVLAYTGCRISEALELTVGQIDTAESAIVFRSLKKRRDDVFRAVPVPGDFVERLGRVHDLRNRQISDQLWPKSRTTGWAYIKQVMAEAGVEGTHASPKGLRHGFGVAATQKGIPLNIVQRWLGHADISMTAIYADAIGDEERALASRLWRSPAA